jgi:hypothetical protein
MHPKVLETPQEWYQCMDAGTAAVRRPYALRQQGIPRLSLYHIPSFKDCYGWTIYQMRGGSDYKLQTVIWRQHADIQRMQDLMVGRVTRVTAVVPTLEESVTDVDSQWFERRLTALAMIRIPLVTKRPIGCDGETFGVHIGSQFEVEWWCDGPPEWTELERWTYDCIEIFRQKTVT